MLVLKGSEQVVGGALELGRPFACLALIIQGGNRDAGVQTDQLHASFAAHI